MFQNPHQRQHCGHDPTAFGKITLQSSGVPKRDMFAWQEVGPRTNPALRALCKELQRLIIHAAGKLDMRIVTRQQMHPIDVIRAFLDRAEIPAAPDAIKEFFAHFNAHPP
jgi:hypothetical protein